MKILLLDLLLYNLIKNLEKKIFSQENFNNVSDILGKTKMHFFFYTVPLSASKVR